MKRFFNFLLCACVMLTCLTGIAAAAEIPQTVRIGLAYGSGALAAPRLQNFAGSGYIAGYYDENQTFHGLYAISEEKVALLKDTNYAKTADGNYTEGGSAVGAYHLQSAVGYATESEARTAAQAASGFVFYDGSYHVRTGSYTTKEAAQAAIAGDMTVVGGSATSVTVVQADTGSILFEYDGGQLFAMAPQGSQPQTWFKGYKYYGNFAYPRTAGSNLSVINYVSLEDYVKGVVPYEMSPSWEIEALKAQAVCARSYAIGSLGKHKSYGFDLCNTTDCQVYRGTGSASENSDNAVNQTAGEYAAVDGKAVTLFFFASDGGATEDAENVWGGDYSYLKGVIDPYEDPNTASYGIWDITMSASEVAAKVKSAGYSIGTVADVAVTKLTPNGNVLQVTVTDTAGKTAVIEKAKCRTVFGLNSQRYNVTGNQGTTTGTVFTAKNTAGTVRKAAASTENTLGASILRGAQEVYQIGTKDSDTSNTTNSADQNQNTNQNTTNSADQNQNTNQNTTQNPSQGTTGTGNAGTVSTSFVFHGQGWGHLVGMSQCGARDMAKQGKTYQEILNFYYTGIQIAK